MQSNNDAAGWEHEWRSSPIEMTTCHYHGWTGGVSSLGGCGQSAFYQNVQGNFCHDCWRQWLKDHDG